uniref:Uncharacterized protein n=1 Tax=Heterorhabditis bacteriophora TaxID=37862 RepID=A0A1I7WM71_HETBA
MTIRREICFHYLLLVNRRLW